MSRSYKQKSWGVRTGYKAFAVLGRLPARDTVWASWCFLPSASGKRTRADQTGKLPLCQTVWDRGCGKGNRRAPGKGAVWLVPLTSCPTVQSLVKGDFPIQCLNTKGNPRNKPSKGEVHCSFPSSQGGRLRGTPATWRVGTWAPGVSEAGDACSECCCRLHLLRAWPRPCTVDVPSSQCC